MPCEIEVLVSMLLALGVMTARVFGRGLPSESTQGAEANFQFRAGRSIPQFIGERRSKWVGRTAEKSGSQ